VDQARQLVDLRRVPAIIGGIISSVSIPIVTSVTGPAGVVQISPASSSPTLTRMATEGQTRGWFFRTITSDALQGTAAARYAMDQGLRRLAIIHVNNDFGVNMVNEFRRAYEALGGQITSVTPYNQGQAGYGPEVTRALRGDPPALYLVSYPGDGTTIARTWIQQGGAQTFLLNDGMNSADFIRDVGPRFLNNAFGTSSGTVSTPSTEFFGQAYPAMSGGFGAGAPAADRAFDAAAILGLAIARAGRFEAQAIRDAIREVTGPGGEVVHAGPDGFRRALELIRAGQRIRYVGRHRPGGVRPERRHHRPLPQVAHPERRDHHHRPDDDRGGAGGPAPPAAVMRPPRALLAPGLESSRIVTGLWQVADQERDGRAFDHAAAAAALVDYAAAGFDSFDMADHYGSAEDIAGLFRRDGGRAAIFTKWVPTPGPMTRAVVRDGVGRSLARLGGPPDLMQFHWWTFHHPAWLDALREMAAMRAEGLLRHLGVTNFDTDHLRVAVRNGVPVATNQVSFSLLDRRAAGEMSAFCLANGVRILAYGTLGGGFLSERWLGRDEPAEPDIADWSKMKYRRFIGEMGGWPAFQRLLREASAIGRRHGVSISNVATRWVLEHPAVGAVIVGARLTEGEHRDDNLRLFSFALDEEDRSRLDGAFAAGRPIPGDCGDEYRKPPYLTASGDLSHHLESLPRIYAATEFRPGRHRVDSGSVWEGACGYSRAVRVGPRILVSGTTATHTDGSVVAPGDAGAQAVYILDKIAAAVEALGGTMDDVVQTRIWLRDAQDWEAVGRVHGRVFATARPANTLVEVGRLVGNYLVEIEAEAIVG
jgi:aryl-alcohol dehydrogenase-like predicted oxidoreductase/ABC-type branched-subunit amino acid transport system substrate-binding protein/enamine deaminase RidA (YjgF/YER057c/UK114 family)